MILSAKDQVGSSFMKSFLPIFIYLFIYGVGHWHMTSHSVLVD